ncbi:MAG: hypothetical protein D6690_03845 [Nitrospirae bacterium]|nr:MAG: hypothetical protein D6690_03845 [Nitrospirota bacterium]
MQEGADAAEWLSPVDAIARSPGVVLVIGRSDCGKTTWIHSATKALFRLGISAIAIVDADLGQSTFGPPTTVGLYCATDSDNFDDDAERGIFHAAAFVGSITPLRHLLQTLTACHRLVDRAKRSGAAIIMVDTSGLISGSAGFQLKWRKVELLAPRHVVALQEEAELEPLLSVIGADSELAIHRRTVPSDIRPRSPAERTAYRNHRFSMYFNDAQAHTLQLESIICLSPPYPRRSWSISMPPVLSPTILQSLSADELSGCLVGLNTATNTTLGLGVVEGLDHPGQALKVWTPLHDLSKVRLVQFSDLRPALPSFSQDRPNASQQ